MSSCALGHQSSAYKGAEYRAPHRQPTQSDLEMDVDVDAELEEKGELQTKGVSRATDFELADYWDYIGLEREGIVAGVRHVECRTFVLSSRLCSVMEILLRALTHVLLVIERTLFGRRATRNGVRTIADVCDVCVPERQTYSRCSDCQWSSRRRLHVSPSMEPFQIQALSVYKYTGQPIKLALNPSLTLAFSRCIVD